MPRWVQFSHALLTSLSRMRPFWSLALTSRGLDILLASSLKWPHAHVKKLLKELQLSSHLWDRYVVRLLKIYVNSPLGVNSPLPMLVRPLSPTCLIYFVICFVKMWDNPPKVVGVFRAVGCYRLFLPWLHSVILSLKWKTPRFDVGTLINALLGSMVSVTGKKVMMYNRNSVSSSNASFLLSVTP